MIVTLLALSAAGQAAPAPASAAAPPQTAQQRFDAASAAVAAGRCIEAIAGFDAVEKLPVYKRSALLAAAVDVRKGVCLVRTGRAAEGASAIGRGLPTLETKGEDFAADVRDAHLALGDAAAERFDYDEAARRYRAAADAVKGPARVQPLIRLAQVAMFDLDGQALAAADEARQLASATPGFDKKSMAIVQTQYARVLLNKGRVPEAYQVLKEVLAKQGGLTSMVGLSDITLRSDLAIAALLNKRPDDARTYLAYTGAGRMKDGPFARAASMNAPACGEGGIAPQDVAVIEFALGSDGRVGGVTPIYTTGGRRAAVAFASAVRDWSWRAEDAAKVPALFRYATRVELRCSKASTGKNILAPLAEAAAAWFTQRSGASPWDDLSDAAALPLQRAALAQARTAGDQPGIARAALLLAASSVVDAKEAPTLLDTAATAATAAGAPTPVRHYIAIRRIAADPDLNTDRTRAALRAMLARPDFSGDPLTADTLRLLIAQPVYRTPPPPDAAALQAAVADDSALPSTHPLKVAALLGQANVLAAKGDLAGARTAFDRTGLTGEQCAQLGLSPAMRSNGASSADYPMEAVRMGFEGWVLAEADVTADGRTTVQRATIAYPPFVFDDAAVGIARDARYASSFRPAGALACQGVRMPIRFSLAP